MGNFYKIIGVAVSVFRIVSCFSMDTDTMDTGTEESQVPFHMRRLEVVQTAVNGMFAKVNTKHGGVHSIWEGRSGIFYHPTCTLNELQLIHSDCTDHYHTFVDIGGGFGATSKKVICDLIEHQKKYPESSENIYNFFNVTGEPISIDNLVVKKCFPLPSSIRFYNIDSCKIENLEQDPRFKDIIGNVDFVASNNTLMHTVDSIGTVSQMYDLLKCEGILATNTFDVFDKRTIMISRYNSDKYTPRSILAFLEQTKEPFLYYPPYGTFCESGMIIIKRTKDTPLQLSSVQYTDTIHEQMYEGGYTEQRAVYWGVRTLHDVKEHTVYLNDPTFLDELRKKEAFLEGSPFLKGTPVPVQDTGGTTGLFKLVEEGKSKE